MLFEFLNSQLEVKPAYEYLGLWVLVSNIQFALLSGAFGLCYHVRVRFLDVRAALGMHWHVTTLLALRLRLALVVIRRLYIHLLVQDVMTLCVSAYDVFLLDFGFFFVLEYHLHKAKASASPCGFIPHYNGISH